MPESNNKKQCVFIGGASRSGTTMLGAMLGSHSKAVVTPESQFKFEERLLNLSREGEAQELFSAIASHARFKVWDMQPSWQDFEDSNLSHCVLEMVNQYAALKQQAEATFWIDHTPTNLRHAHFLDEHYPECLFIHIVRDGRAVMASQFKLDWGSNDPIFASMKWIEPLCVGFACESAFPDRTLRVYYEDLVEQPTAECKRICEFMKIPFEAEMIKGSDFEVPLFTKAQHQLVGQMPDPKRINDWKKTLRKKDIQLFESMTFDLLPMLGYQKEFPGIVAKPKESKQAWILFNGALRYLTIDIWRRRRRIAAQINSEPK